MAHLVRLVRSARARQWIIHHTGDGAWHHWSRLGPSLMRILVSSVRGGFCPSAPLCGQCPLCGKVFGRFCDHARVCPISGDRSIRGHVCLGQIVVRAPSGGGLNSEKEAGALSDLCSATDDPPHRACHHRPAEAIAAWTFALASCFKPSHTVREQL